jgi:hypothetical protein
VVILDEGEEAINYPGKGAKVIVVAEGLYE